jgi:hypothetical protein
MPVINTNLVLGVHLCQSSNCKIITLTETTGAYNVSNNPGGWGAPNPETNSLDSLQVIITTPANTPYTFTTIAGWPDVTGNVEANFSIGSNGAIQNNSNGTTAFSDGIYTVQYTVNGTIAPNTYTATTTQQFLLTCQIRCCIDKMFHLASQSDCTDCKNEKLSNALEAEAFLKAAEYDAACGKIEMAKKHLAKAQWICNTKNCLNC